MKTLVIYSILVFGLVAGQRDRVVNRRRSRQRSNAGRAIQLNTENSQELERDFSSANGFSPVPDPFRISRVSNPSKRRRVIQRERAYADPALDSSSASARYVDPPYHELGASERIRIYGGDQQSYDDTSLVGGEGELTDTPYYESGERRRQSVSDQYYARNIRQRSRSGESADYVIAAERRSSVAEQLDNNSDRSSSSAGGQYDSQEELQRSESQTLHTRASLRTRTRQRSRGVGANSNEIVDYAVDKPAKSLKTTSTRSRSRQRIRPTVSRTAQQEPEPEAQSTRASSSGSTRQRSRSRSRFTSRTSPKTESRSFGRPEVGRPRLNPRLDVSRDQDSQPRATSRSLKTGRIDSQDTSRTSDYKKQVFRVKFPKKNLIPGVPKVSYSPKESIPEDDRINRFRSDIKPSRTRIEPEEVDQTPEIQSSKEENDDFITVTHQVPAKTIFTVLEGKETKSLFIDTFTTSLQAVSVKDLKSTYIEESPVIYAKSAVITQGYGVEETLYDGIHPTRTVIAYATSTVGRGARESEVVSTEYSTIYNVQTVTVRNTENIAASLTPDITQIGSLLQTVILGLLGGNILGGNGVPGQQNILGGGLVPQTNYVTHTRSFVTTTTSIDTVLIPVTFRGSEIFKTVTDTKTQVLTETDLSIQTLIQPGLATASTPFLPLAPTLHRATRVVPTLPAYPVLPLAPSPAINVITHTSTSVTTINSEITSDLVITLGGREVQTHIVQPTKQILTVTSFSTETVTYQPNNQAVVPPLNQLGLLRAILQLNSLQG